MKLQEILNKIMGIRHPPAVLMQLEDIGFIDTEETLDNYKILRYGNHKILYDSDNDVVVNFYKYRLDVYPEVGIYCLNKSGGGK